MKCEEVKFKRFYCEVHTARLRAASPLRTALRGRCPSSCGLHSAPGPGLSPATSVFQNKDRPLGPVVVTWKNADCFKTTEWTLQGR